MHQKIIFKCRVGSWLYGTNRPSSDEDFAGVVLHTEDQLFSVNSRPKEIIDNCKYSLGPTNEKGDVDCKYFYLPRFLELVGKGNPGQLEMLFAPEECILIETKEWKQIKDNINLFKTKKAIVPFLGFSRSQIKRSNNNKKVKSLSHAVRLLYQAEEFLTTGNIIFPLSQAPLLKKILNEEELGIDWDGWLSEKIRFIEEEILPKSTLSSEINWEEINDLCIKIQKQSILGV